MMYEICVFGHFAKGKQLLNGQTIKTKIVTEELRNQLGQERVSTIDTHGGIKALLKAPFQVLKALKNARHIIILPAHNGVRIYAPLLNFFKRFFKGRKLHYIVIGGWLASFLQSKNSLRKKLKRFDGIYVETNAMKLALEEQGFVNSFVMPNCKNLSILTKEELVYAKAEPYKLCTFSRVSKEKGIGDAVEAVVAVNEYFGRQVFSLDIYGQVDLPQTQWFEDLKRTFPEYIRYGGLIPFDSSVNVLKDYYALLFPTYYDGEGFAGTLLDAYSAGVPVIASDWKYNPELVDSEVGYLYPARDQAMFIEVLKTVAKNSEKVNALKETCLARAKDYSPSKVVGEFIENIGCK